MIILYILIGCFAFAGICGWLMTKKGVLKDLGNIAFWIYRAFWAIVAILVIVVIVTSVFA